MSTPVNLNRFRKEKAKKAKKAKADANAIAFGRTKSEKEHAKRETSRMARQLDGKVFQTPSGQTKDGPKKT